MAYRLRQLYLGHSGSASSGLTSTEQLLYRHEGAGCSLWRREEAAAALRSLRASIIPAIFVYSTCIVGSSERPAVCVQKASEELAIPVLPVKSEGFRETRTRLQSSLQRSQ